MVSVTSYTYPTETENDNSQFQSQTQSQGLSQSLRDSIEGNIAAFDAMEQSGLLTRTVYPEVPPRVEYRLTERGGSLLPHIFGLVEWAEANKEAILDGRRRS